ncbi:MAG: surface carbohydrate biosynthesis protein [Vicinamibacterales bacterium]
MVTVSPRRWLILPLEIKARELHAKMLLALVAAERGWGVIVGDKLATRGARDVLPRGTFLEKSIQPGREASIFKAIGVGHRVSTTCEEGLLYLQKDYYKERRISRPAFDAIDYFFAWGTRHAEDVDDGSGKVVSSGNPRMDVLRPEWRDVFMPAARRIQERYGKIILVNSRFPVVSHALPSLLNVRHGAAPTGDNEQIWRRYVALQGELFPYFLGVLPRLSETFPEHTIVVRPHPAENPTPWLERAGELSNVKVIYEGSANEWILASDVAIQNNCFTGVEAYLLDKPSISYRPFRDEGVEVALTNQVGLQACSEDELITCLQRVIRGEEDVPGLYLRQRDGVRRYVSNLDGALACEAFMDAFDRLDLPVSSGRFPIPRRMKDALRSLRTLFSPIKAYSRQKFPGIDLVEVQQILHSFQEASDRFTDVEIVPSTAGGFCVYRP